MFLKIEDIGPEGLEVVEPVAAGVLASWLGDDDIYQVSGDGTVELRADRVGRDILVKGRITAPLKAECSRCLADIGLGADVAFTVLFSERSAFGPAQEEAEGDGGQQFYSGPVIELDEALRDELVLSLPMVPRCAEDCKGLCPSCGVNLNAGACGCVAVETPVASALRVNKRKSLS
jgi:uncharacterized protein